MPSIFSRLQFYFGMLDEEKSSRMGIFSIVFHLGHFPKVKMNETSITSHRHIFLTQMRQISVKGFNYKQIKFSAHKVMWRMKGFACGIHPTFFIPTGQYFQKLQN